MAAFSGLSGGIVTLPLLASSLVSLTLIGERLWFWTKLHRRQRRLAREVLLSYPDRTQFILQKLRQNSDLPIARISLKALSRDRLSPDEFRLALESAAQAEIPLLRRFNTIFETIITTAPLLGLLGTILGLIAAFSALNLGDIANSETLEVTTGISEALVSTVLGLIVAIFTLIFANLFRGFYRRQIAFLQEYGGELELLHRQSQKVVKSSKS
ncbi:MAG: MotA/TolQ/ExbB proton channel family protein [Jaaginema sp. PMC 1079.18]|nr:MotA/TolQ/ExbB proton channel family protein [Jaaginema sp. PMC 1080.18]MEC4851633.1 MotA/TolQ/ExbB proton channel family protein [Jaaginema sp. PMC 1079.18]MEC4866730.1 MotA/TolQ/ExbB proton channel family protein [Jaaginema sp. PMC 1078.18]